MPSGRTATCRASRGWPPGETCVVDPETFACLRIALAIERATGGAFDIAYRARPHRAAYELIQLGDKTPAVTALATSAALDLGGIGKGFALDHMAAVLADWDLHCALLRASKSTVLARQAPPGTPAGRSGSGRGQPRVP